MIGFDIKIHLYYCEVNIKDDKKASSKDHKKATHQSQKLSSNLETHFVDDKFERKLRNSISLKSDLLEEIDNNKIFEKNVEKMKD